MSTFALLLMLALGIDHSGTLVSSEKGGDSDLVSQDATPTGTDALSDDTAGHGAGSVSRHQQASSGGGSSPAPAVSSLRDAIAEYRRNGGVKYWVRGKTDAQHVVEDHGWTYQQIAGLSLDDIQYLHGASHTGKLKPSMFGAVPAPFTPAEGRPTDKPQQAADTKPALTITLAPFHCPPCNQVKRMDWSSDFDVKFTYGGQTESGMYPEFSWRNETGKKWWKAGAYTPTQIMGLVERTQ